MNNKSKIENATIINGVTLTEDAIERLKQLQERNNDGIDEVQKGLANALCLISANLDYFDHGDDLKKVKLILTDLAIVRDWFDDLRKP